MPHLNEEATQIFKDLIARLGDADYVKLDSGRGYAPLSIDRLGENEYAMAHNHIQNGDVMADPDMEFKVVDGEVFPLTYQNDNVGIFNQCTGRDGTVDQTVQKAMADFANTWMSNLKKQQLCKAEAL